MASIAGTGTCTASTTLLQLATSASLENDGSSGIATDTIGNIYLSEFNAKSVRMLTTFSPAAIPVDFPDSNPFHAPFLEPLCFSFHYSFLFTDANSNFYSIYISNPCTHKYSIADFEAINDPDKCSICRSNGISNNTTHCSSNRFRKPLTIPLHHLDFRPWLRQENLVLFLNLQRLDYLLQSPTHHNKVFLSNSMRRPKNLCKN